MEVLSSPLEKVNSYISAVSAIIALVAEVKGSDCRESQVLLLASSVIQSEVKSFVAEILLLTDYTDNLIEFSKELELIKLGADAVKVISECIN